MKFKIQYLFVLLFLFSFASCKGEDIFISGRITQDCQGNIPYANQDVHFKSLKRKGYNKKKGISKIIQTNANGEFSFLYNTKGVSSENIFIDNLFGEAQNEISERGIPIGKSIALGNLSLNNSLPLRFVLKVSNVYSSQDTLIVIDPFGTTVNDEIKIAGPFNDNEVISSGLKSGLKPQLKNNEIILSYRISPSPRIKLADGTFIQASSSSVEVSNCQIDSKDVFISVD